MVSAAAASALSPSLTRSPLAVPALQLRSLSLSNPNVADGGGDREEAAGGQCR